MSGRATTVSATKANWKDGGQGAKICFFCFSPHMHPKSRFLLLCDIPPGCELLDYESRFLFPYTIFHPAVSYSSTKEAMRSWFRANIGDGTPLGAKN